MAWKNARVPPSFTSTRAESSTPSNAAASSTDVSRAGDPTRQLLRHIMVVGGTLRDWDELGDDRWDDRVERLGAIA
ncbi:MAG TPA: hypothetical protein VLN74_10045, partial [Ilumatobacteraceae bacterium]|nr:hypothetical protein [Ilumatobacteraceae bacterium]